MSVIYSNDWDAETTGALPSGWANKVGTWQVATTNPVSGAKTFLSSSNGDGDVVLLTSGVSAKTDMQIDSNQVAVLASGVYPLVGHILRSDSTNANHYVVLFSANNGTTTKCLVFKKVGGSYTQILDQFGISFACSAGDVVNVRSKIVGTTITVYLGKNSGGLTQIATVTDSSVSAAGYAGLYNGKDAVSVTMSLDDFVLDDLAVAAATAVTMTGPSTGATGVASSNFSVGVSPVGGTITGTLVVTPSDGGAGGTFTPATVSLTTGSPTGTFTYTPASVGAKTISATNGGGLSNPSSLTYTATAGAVSVATSDANWKFSPYNWADASGVKVAVNGGAYFKLGFTGTSISVGLDVGSLVSGGVASGWYPYLRYSVDNGALTDIQLTSASNALAVSGLSAGSHTIEVWYQAGFWENIGGTAPDRWTTPVYCIKITGATLDAGASTVAPTWLSNSMIWFGDSISEGIRANNSTTQPANQSAYDSVPAYVAQALGCELGNCSFGGVNYNAGFNAVPGLLSAYQYVYSGKSRLVGGVLSPAPAYVCIWNGANGNPAQADVQTAIGNMRTIAPSARICVIVAIGGTGRANVTAAVAAYQAANPTDSKVALVDLGTSWGVGLSSFGAATKQSIDGLHPRATWNARIGAEIARVIGAIGSRPSATKSVSLSLKDRDGTQLAGATGYSAAFFDVSTPASIQSASWAGSIPAADGMGNVTLTVTTSLTSGQTGLLVVSNTSGSAASQSQACALPVVVS